MPQNVENIYFFTNKQQTKSVSHYSAEEKELCTAIGNPSMKGKMYGTFLGHNDMT